MKRKEFATVLIPQLAQAWSDGQVPFSSLVAFDFWRQLFPDPTIGEGNFLDPDDIPWYQIQLNAFSLTDGSFLLVYGLPKAQKYKDVQFVALRLNRETHSYVCYVLRRPQYIDDEWEICTVSADGKEPRYYGPINGTWSLRCFWLTINGIPFDLPQHVKPWDKFKGMIRGLSSQQNDSVG